MPNIIVPKKYPCFANVNEIYTLCEPLFSASEVNMFTYVRAYNDGSIFALNTNTKYEEHLLYNLCGEVCIDFNLLNVGAKSKHFSINKGNKRSWLMHEVWEGDYWANLYKNFDIANYLCIFENVTNYYEAFYFASSIDKNILSFYINHYDVLENFMLYFKERGADLIKTAEKNKILIPNRNTEYAKTLKNLQNKVTVEQYQFSKLQNALKLKRYPISHKTNDSYITPRELECLRCVAQRHTAKETGKILHLSPRTVEAHLQNIKNRLGIDSVKQLVTIFLASSLANLQ